MTAPTLILIGEAGDWTPAKRCRVMVAHARPDGAPIALTVYPGAHHGSTLRYCSPAEALSATGSNTTSRRPRTRKKRRAHSSTLISPRHLPASRRQSDPIWAKRFLIAALTEPRGADVRADPPGPAAPYTGSFSLV